MLLYAVTIFTSAFLLFLVQPIIAKQILPWFGGSAAVWTTCLVFFQSLLLAGYAYSDWTTRKLTARRQVALHIVLLAASLASLPDTIAGRALIAYHLAEQRPMMGAFLDALGIAHENGLIQQEDAKPEASKVAPAAAELASKFPQGDVQLYLNTLLCQDPETWGALRDVPALRD